MTTHTLLSLAEVEDRIGAKKSAIYERMRRGEFPKPIHLSRRCARWLEAEIDAWEAKRIEQAIAERDAGPGGESCASA